MDLAKAFDTVSIPILINKLECIGVRDTHTPQGSILGPTLFLIYIDFLTRLELVKGQIISYADDTVLVFAADSWKEVFEVAQLGLNSVTKWLQTIPYR